MSTLRQRIKELGASQQAIADAAGVTKQAVTNWMARDALSRDSAEKLAEAYQVSLDWLLMGQGPMRPESKAYGSGTASHVKAAEPSHPDYRRQSLSIVRLELALREVEEAAAMLGVKMSYAEKAARIAERYEAAAEPQSGASGGSVSAAL